MKIILFLLSVLLCLCFSACSENQSIGIIGGADGPTSIYINKQGETAMYKQISQEEAKQIMETNEQYILLDVREQNEFDAGHIPGAILIPYAKIQSQAKEKLPDKNALILVYCRSGRRSKIAAEALAAMGYTDIREFGGIIDWQFDIEK